MYWHCKLTTQFQNFRRRHNQEHEKVRERAKKTPVEKEHDDQKASTSRVDEVSPKKVYGFSQYKPLSRPSTEDDFSISTHVKVSTE